VRPKALLWDFGNVIVRWNPRTLYEKIFQEPDERDRFLSHVCPLDWHAATDCGVTFADNIAAKVAEHPHYEAQIRAWHERWDEMFSGPIPETETAMHDLHGLGVAQYGLSNISHETLHATLAMSPAFDRLDGYVASGLEGVMKPDPEIFVICCTRFGLAPGDFLFVDDSARNIETAAALGFDVHHFTDPAALRPALEARGLL
jgi:2-haloacid dehalogenase/putative hydrolase of the HAD superfamily